MSSASIFRLAMEFVEVQCIERRPERYKDREKERKETFFNLLALWQAFETPAILVKNNEEIRLLE